MGHKSVQNAPHVVTGILQTDAGLLFQGWTREGRWIGGCLFNERGAVIFGDPFNSKQRIEAAIVEHQARLEARRATLERWDQSTPVYEAARV